MAITETSPVPIVPGVDPGDQRPAVVKVRTKDGTLHTSPAGAYGQAVIGMVRSVQGRNGTSTILTLQPSDECVIVIPTDRIEYVVVDAVEAVA